MVDVSISGTYVIHTGHVWINGLLSDVIDIGFSIVQGSGIGPTLLFVFVVWCAFVASNKYYIHTYIHTSEMNLLTALLRLPRPPPHTGWRRLTHVAENEEQNLESVVFSATAVQPLGTVLPVVPFETRSTVTVDGPSDTRCQSTSCLCRNKMYNKSTTNRSMPNGFRRLQ